MTLERIKELFKAFGKIIRLKDVAAAGAGDMKEVAVNTVKQFSQQSGDVDLYDDLITVIVPFEQRVQQVGGSIDRTPSICRATVETYLRTIAPEINQNTAANTSAILTTLAAQMGTAGATVYPSGAFYNYFSTEFGFNGFPQSSSARIFDDWITTAVVPAQETRIVSVTNLGGNYGRVEFDELISLAFGTWSFQVFDGETWQTSLEVTGGASGPEFSVIVAMPIPLNSSPPWRILTDDGSVTWTKPPLRLPQSGTVIGA